MIAIAAPVERLDEQRLRTVLREADAPGEPDDDALPPADSARVLDWTVERICACGRAASARAA